MTSVTVSFHNADEDPLLIQVEPWACVYRLLRDESIEFIAESESESPRMSVNRHQGTTYLWILDSQDFFVVVDGKRIPWTEYPANFG